MDVNFNSQFGTSIPLVDIIERGDGYIKFANGLQICYGSLYCTMSSSTVGSGYTNYKSEFKSCPFTAVSSIISSMPDGDYSHDSILGTDAALSQLKMNNISIKRTYISNKYIYISIVSSSSAMKDMNAECGYIVIGKWK
jgi:hypothetical protein